jgi:MFS family permease
VLTASNAPIFFAFFTWGFGTGAQHLARPLFAYALTGNVMIVALVVSVNAIPRVLMAPFIGLLIDRFGRKPLAIFGAGLRGVTNVGQFLSGDVLTFVLFEFIGQIGVITWGTSSNVLVADLTSTANRGRVQALRQMSLRIGFIAGPAVGGLLIGLFDIRSLFLLNGLSKAVIVLTVLLMVKESRSKATREQDRAKPVGSVERPALLRMVRTRSFLALILTVSAMSMAQASILQTLLPIHAQEVLGASESAVGLMISIAAMFFVLVAFPNGMISDRFGRKKSIVPGMMLLSLAMLVLTFTDGFGFLLLAVAIQGSGEGMTMGTTQTYAMDLAPPSRRGAFLGMVMAFQAAGAFSGPLLVAALYNSISPEVAFGALALWLGLGGLAMAILGRETAGHGLAHADAERIK